MNVRSALTFVLALCFSITSWTGASAQTDSADTMELRDAEFLMNPSDQPPIETPGWAVQTLPDWWLPNQARHDASGWYRLRFQLQTVPGVLYAVYLPRLGLNAEVYLGRHALGRGGSFDEPIARYWNRPLLFIIPPGLLQPGENTLFVRLRGHAYTQPYLFPILLGSESELRREFEHTLFRNVTINQTASLLIATIGIFMLNLWWRRRKETAYGLFGVSALVWAAQSTNLFLVQIPVSTAFWEILVNASFQVFSALLLISLLRFVAVDMPRFNRALWLMMLISPLSLLAAPANFFLQLTSLWHLLTVIAALFTLFVLLREGLLRHNRDARMLVTAMGIIVLFALHDWLMHSQHRLLFGLKPLLQKDIYMLHFAAPVLFFMIGMIMTARYARVLNEFETLNRDLEQRVAEKHAQLEASFIRMSEMEKEKATREERERIHGDLHDDVGAKLLSLVYRAGSQEDADLARSALQDLRDVVSHTQAEHFALEDAFADWRSEAERRLSDAGIRLEWQQDDDDPIHELKLTQPQALNVTRILREGVSNVIRHANASRVWLSIRVQTDGLHIRLEDDGVGEPHKPPCVSGRGLLNMQNRAKKLGAVLRCYEIHPHGFGVELHLPI